MPKTKQKYKNIITLRLSDEQLTDLKRYAYEYEECSMTDIIRDVLDQRLDEYRKAAI